MKKIILIMWVHLFLSTIIFSMYIVYCNMYNM